MLGRFFSAASRKSRNERRARPAAARLSLETLESRLNPSTVVASSFFDSAIYEVDSNTGDIQKTLIAPYSQALLSGPAGITLGPDQNLYISSQFNDKILRYDMATDTLSTFIDTALLTSVASSVDAPAFAPAGLTFGPDGDLYVALNGGYGSGSVGAVIHFDVHLGVLGLQATGTSSVVTSGLVQPSAVTFGAGISDADSLYISNTFAGEILKVGSATGTPTAATQFVAAGANGMVFPSGLTWDDNVLYVADLGGILPDAATGKILKFNADGTANGTIAPSSPTLADKFPSSVAIDSDGNILTANLGRDYPPQLAGSIFKFLSDGTYDTTLVSSADFPDNGPLPGYEAYYPYVFASGISPSQLLILPDEAPRPIIASSFFDGGLYQFDADNGALLSSLIPAYTSALLSGPAGMTIGPDRNLYISSQFNNAILRYDLRTQTLSTFIDSGTLDDIADAAGASTFAPAGLSFGPDGDLYVVLNAGYSSFMEGGVVRFDVTVGAHSLEFAGTSTRIASGLIQPSAVIFGKTADDAETLYISNTFYGDILKIESAPTVTSPTSNPELRSEFIAPGAGGMVFPTGLTWGPDGLLYVADLGGIDADLADGKIVTFNPDGSANGTIAPVSPSLANKFPSSIAFDVAGNILVGNLGKEYPPHLVGSIFQFTPAGVYNQTLVSSADFPDNGPVPGYEEFYPSVFTSGVSPSQLVIEPLHLKDTTTIVAAPLAGPYAVGDAVTLSVTVSANGAFQTTPTGTVTFYVDGVSVASVALVAGEASYSTTSLAVGLHSLRAVYSGDSNHFTSQTTVTPRIESKNIVVAASFFDSSLYEFDSVTGAVVKTLIAPYSQSLLSGPAGVTLGPDRALYISSQFNDKILRYDLATDVLSTFIDTAALSSVAMSVDAAAFAPAGLTFGPDGDLYVTLNGGYGSDAIGAVVRFDIHLGVLGLTPTGSSFVVTGGLAQPSAIAFGVGSGDANTIYVSNTFAGEVLKVDSATSTPSAASQFIAPGTGGLVFPTGLTWSNGVLYVSDLGGILAEAATGQVIKYNSDGSVNGVIAPSSPTLANKFPSSVAIGSDGSVLVGNLGKDYPPNLAGSIFKFDPDGAFNRTLVGSDDFPDNGPLPGYEAYYPLVYASGISPSQLLILPEEASRPIIASSFFDGGLYQFDSANGDLLNSLIPAYSSALLSGPAGVTVGPDRNLYISSQFSNEILRYDLRTQTLSTFIDSDTLDDIADAAGATTFAPAGLTFGPDGDLYVVLNAGYSSFMEGGVVRFDVSVGAHGLEFDGTSTRIAAGLIQPSAVVFGKTASDAHTLYISNTFYGDVLKIESASTVTSPTSNPELRSEFIAPGTGGLVFPTGLTWGPDGLLYVADLGGINAELATGKVVKFNPDGTANGTIAPGSPSLANKFPSSIAFDVAGNILVGNLGKDYPPHLVGSIFQFDSAGVYNQTLVSSDDFPDNGPLPGYEAYYPTVYAAGISPSQLVIEPLHLKDTTTVTGVPAPGPYAVGNTVFWTVTVAANGAFETTPTGSVTFYVDGVSTQTVSLSGGTATFSTSSLAAGTHSLRAVYSGDVNFYTSEKTTTVSLETESIVVAASFFDSSIYEFSSVTGAIVKTLVQPYSSSLLQGPAGVTLGPDRNLYISSQFNNKILRYDLATDTLSTFIDSAALASVAGSVSAPTFAPAGLTFGPDGDLYIALNGGYGSGAVGAVVRFDIHLGVLGLAPSGSSFVITSGLVQPSAVAFGVGVNDATTLYVTNTFAGDVLKIGSATGTPTPATQFITAGTGGLVYPTGLTWNDGSLFVSDLGGILPDAATGKVIKFNADGTVDNVIEPMSPSLADKFPSSVAIDANGNILTGNLGREYPPNLSGSIFKFAPDGTFDRTLVSSGDFPDNGSVPGYGELYPYVYASGISPSQLLILPNEASRPIFASSFFDSALYSFDADTGALLSTAVSPYTIAGPLSGPAGMTLGPDRNLYISSQFNNTILRFDTRSLTMSTFIDSSVLSALATAAGAETFAPAGLTFGPDGDLYVAFNGGYGSGAIGGVVRFDVVIGAHGLVYDNNAVQIATGLTQPSAITFGTMTENADTLFISNTFAGNILAIAEAPTIDSPTGNPELRSEFVALGTGGMIFPAGLAWGPNGVLYVTDLGGIDADLANGKVLKFNTSGAFNGLIEPISPSLADKFPSAVAFDVRGNILVGNLGRNYPPALVGSIFQFSNIGIYQQTLVSSDDFPNNGPFPLNPVVNATGISPSQIIVAAIHLKDTSTLSGTLSPNPVNVGELISLPVTVAANGVFETMPTGSVTFYVDGAVAETVALVDGQATFTISTLPAGYHSFRSVYSGDVNFYGSEKTESILVRSLAAPTIASLVPVIGPTTGGTLVVINGSNLADTLQVTFDGLDATTFTIISGSQISAVTAAHAAGKVNVVVTNSAGSGSLDGSEDFTYAPSVASVLVNGGPGVTLSSTGTVVSLADQNSVVKQILVTFHEAVTVASDAFTVTPRTANVTVNGGAAPSTAAVQTSVTMLSASTYLVTFVSDGIGAGPGGVLKSGVYDLTVIASKVSANGVALAANQTTTFFAMFGTIDANNSYTMGTMGDGQSNAFVDPGSLFQFSDAFGSSSTALSGPPPYNVVFDSNLDGAIDPGDLFAFSDSFGIDWTF